ncbi:MAG: RING finger protein [Armatimonadia bacterium]
MRCPYCQQNIRVQGRFCPKCGQQIFGLPVRRETPGAAAPEAPQAPAPSRPEPARPSPPPYRPFGAPPDLADDGIVIESQEPSATAGPSAPTVQGVHPATEEEIGKTCPYCRFPLKPGEQVMTCPACKLPHHADCWAENQGCTTYGCRGVAPTPAPTFGGGGGLPTTRPVTPQRPVADVLGEMGFNPQEAELDGRGTTALIIAILGILVCCLPGPGVVAIVMGARILADANIRRLTAASARSKAIWAIVLGSVGVLANIAAIVMMAGRGGGMG